MDSQSVHTRYDDITPYTSKDRSIVRELMHPSTHGNVNQSFAEAEVPVGASTLLHVHMKSEEIYHITAGQGMMSLGGREFQVRWKGAGRPSNPPTTVDGIISSTLEGDHENFKQKSVPNSYGLGCV